MLESLSAAQIALGLAGGCAAGLINTVAGSGSLVTLPVLVSLGLDTPTANGTNRVGVVAQSIVGAATMRRAGHLRWAPRRALWVAASIAGAICGAWGAAGASARALDAVIVAVTLAMLLIVARGKAAWEPSEEQERELGPLASGALFFAIGAYGGFIQAGVGVMLMIALVGAARLAVVEATAWKIALALGFTGVALAIFLAEGLVDWPIALLLSGGQAAGAWIGARFVSGSPRAAIWVRRALIAALIVGAARFGWRLIAAP